MNHEQMPEEMPVDGQEIVNPEEARNLADADIRTWSNSRGEPMTGTKEQYDEYFEGLKGNTN